MTIPDAKLVLFACILTAMVLSAVAIGIVLFCLGSFVNRFGPKHKPTITHSILPKRTVRYTSHTDSC